MIAKTLTDMITRNTDLLLFLIMKSKNHRKHIEVTNNAMVVSVSSINKCITINYTMA